MIQRLKQLLWSAAGNSYLRTVLVCMLLALSFWPSEATVGYVVRLILFVSSFTMLGLLIEPHAFRLIVPGGGEDGKEAETSPKPTREGPG